MLISLSSRVFALPTTLSLGTFIKHIPTPKSSSLQFKPVSIQKATRALSSAGGGVHRTHFEGLTSNQKHQIHVYIDTLLQWNQKMNLTAVKEENEVMERHVEDSLAIIDPIRSFYLSHCGESLENVSVVDVGSGAGLPGLILAIACPGWKVTLLESMNKRCVFLENVAGLVGLPNVQVVRDRAECLGQEDAFRESFDVAVARAVAEMRILAEYCLPLVRVGGLFVAAKGHDPKEEVARAERAICLMGASLLQTCSGEPAFAILKMCSPKNPKISKGNLGHLLGITQQIWAKNSSYMSERWFHPEEISSLSRYPIEITAVK